MNNNRVSFFPLILRLDAFLTVLHNHRGKLNDKRRRTKSQITITFIVRDQKCACGSWWEPVLKNTEAPERRITEVTKSGTLTDKMGNLRRDNGKRIRCRTDAADTVCG